MECAEHHRLTIYDKCYIDFSEGDVFPLNILFLRIAEASSIAHLEKVERGYENMDHYNTDFKKEGNALRSIDFIQGEADKLVMVTFSCLQLTLVVMRLASPFLFFLQMTKTRTKRTRTAKQAPRKERGPRLFQEAALLQPPPSNLLPPSK